jgi:DinB family protein
MKELAEYRVNLMKRLQEAANEFRAECLKVPDPQAPLDADGWTVHQIAVHTRDVDELVYSLRARRTAMEENPEFPNFDGQSHMSASYRASDPLDEVLSRLVENVRSLVEWLQSLPQEAWSRVSRHMTLGSELTLQSWVEKDLAHIEEHLKAVRRLSHS